MSCSGFKCGETVHCSFTSVGYRAATFQTLLLSTWQINFRGNRRGNIRSPLQYYKSLKFIFNNRNPFVLRNRSEQKEAERPTRQKWHIPIPSYLYFHTEPKATLHLTNITGRERGGRQQVTCSRQFHASERWKWQQRAHKKVWYRSCMWVLLCCCGR